MRAPYRKGLAAALLSMSIGALAAVVAEGDAAGSSENVQRPAGLQTRQAFIQALQRVQAGQPDLPDGKALRQYVIYDYLLAARLRRDLQRAPADGPSAIELDERIAGFLDTHANQPVARALRREWLLKLALRGRWDQFLPRTASAGDAVMRCWRFAGRLATNDVQGLAEDMLSRWREPRPQPAECETPYAWLRSQGVITPAMAEERTRAALSDGNWRVARESADLVPEPVRQPLQLWMRLLQYPLPDLQALARDPERPVESPALVAGFAKLAVADNDAAALLLPALARRRELSPETRGQLQRALALGAAYSRRPRALEAFDQVPEPQVDGAVQEWRVRAALWAGQYERAWQWIAGMPADLAAQPRWRYWQARALERTSGEQAAAPSYAELAGLRDYYGYLAADRLHRDYRIGAKPLVADAVLQKSLAADTGLRRAHALFDCNQDDDAMAEWAAALSDADASTRVQAALLAHRWGWYAQSIATLAQQGQWDDVKLRYPRPFAVEVARAGERTRLRQDWIYALIRQESLYRVDAVSSAGARGLMQVMPGTAAPLARRWKIPYASSEALFDPATAILLGSAHLRELQDKYRDSLPLSVAAYNAGAASVARWQPPRTLEADVWIENIPYTETRTYVQRVLEHIVAFAWVREAPLPRISDLMPDIDAPRTD